jgi:hypothetical protein
MIEDHIDELSPVLRTMFVLRIVREHTNNWGCEDIERAGNTVRARLCGAYVVNSLDA